MDYKKLKKEFLAKQKEDDRKRAIKRVIEAHQISRRKRYQKERK